MKKRKSHRNELFEECYELVEKLGGSEQAEGISEERTERRYKITVLRCLAFLVLRLSLLHMLVVLALGLLLAKLF